VHADANAQVHLVIGESLTNKKKPPYVCHGYSVPFM